MRPFFRVRSFVFISILFAVFLRQFKEILTVTYYQ